MSSEETSTRLPKNLVFQTVPHNDRTIHDSLTLLWNSRYCIPIVKSTMQLGEETESSTKRHKLEAICISRHIQFG